MQLFPLYTTLKDKCVLVVGGGDVAERKVQLMLQAGACVCLVAPDVNKSLELLAHDNRITVIRQVFHPVYLDDAWFVIAATNQTDVNAQVAQAASERKLFVNVVDDPALSSVHVPAIVNRSPLVVAISSTGAAPMIARHVREQIETLVDDAMGELTALAQAYRPQIRQQYPGMPARRQFYEWLIQGPVLQHLRNDNALLATRELENALQNPDTPAPGHTIQISITSDDPGDITLNTLRALNKADIIFHDEGISARILDLARRDADRCSYQPGNHNSGPRVPEHIHQQLKLHTAQGHVSVVLTRPFPQQVAALYPPIPDPLNPHTNRVSVNS